ncbi:MAG: hypothetical protein DRH15_10070 [Deltaproteobacteria bacterium]|nr:MAG: hypothetical protein DRH15_10070 [Deltaproteobacteria bacterium]
MKNYSLEAVKNILFHLNYRWKLHSFCFWKGIPSPFSPEALYQGFEDFLSPNTYRCLDGILGTDLEGKKLRFNFIEHFLQMELMPYEAELRTWMKGAAAYVRGQKIYFREIIPYCQKNSTREDRLILQRETRALCRFLKPFAVTFWEILLETLRDSLGFADYLGYCKAKKGIDYTKYYGEVKDILVKTDKPYFEAMEHWASSRFGVGLKELTRFDAINLLSLSEFDHLFPPGALESLRRFFTNWDLDLDENRSITIEMDKAPEKSPQAICFVLEVPDEVYVLVKPQGGWIDVEGLGHELGHALFAANTSPRLPFVHREICMGGALSEAFAFLIQNMTMSVPFMVEQLGVDEQIADMLYRYKALRDLSVFRRYGARFLSEVEMFRSGDFGTGKVYSEFMRRYTGFFYQPEACLFDLVPEFYSLEYVMAWMGEAMMEKSLREKFGERWMFEPKAADLIRDWWSEGCRDELDGFLRRKSLGELSAECLLDRWGSTIWS